MAFRYFEILVELGDMNKFFEEETRLRSLANVLNDAGYQSFLYEDFADAMFDSMRTLSAASQSGNAQDALATMFEDENLQNSIIVYLKVRRQGVLVRCTPR